MRYDIASALSSTPARTLETPHSVTPPSSGRDSQPPSAVASGQTLPPGAQQPAANDTKLGKVVKQLNEYAQSIQREVEFNIDSDSGQTLVKVIDTKTKEVIRQIPSEEALSVARYLSRGHGLVFHGKA